MKTRNIILSTIALFAFTSCGNINLLDDMFEPAKENNRTEDVMSEESAWAHGLLMYGYERLPYVTTSTWDIATDDAVTNVTGDAFRLMAIGEWRANNNPMSQWDARKDAIQYLNLFLSKVNDVRWAPSAVSKQQMFIDRLTGEALGLRALQYYYLLFAHAGYAADGVLYGVPMLTEPEDASSDFNQPRATFATCIRQMFADCDRAIELLPLDYGDLKYGEEDKIPARYRELGAQVSGYNLIFGDVAKLLMSGRIVEAIKAQIALLAVSPAFIDQSGVSAAEAADIIAACLDRIGGIDGLDPKGNVWYKNKTQLEPKSSEMAEIIWREPHHNNNAQEKDNFPPTFSGGGKINPSQNLVDAFPMISGLPITDPASGYDPQNPYANRDSRLSDYVIYNGMVFKKKAIITGNYLDEESKNDDNINAKANSTRTGYYLKKLLREECSVSSNSQLNQYHVYPRIRYTEIFLAYAEAANEAWGPTGKGSHGYSAFDVIKAIRQRAGIGVYSDAIGAPGYDHGDPYLDRAAADINLMRELIRNERRIELCFENKRFWDLRRWKMPLNEAIKGVQIERDNETETLTYSIITVEERDFDNSYQCYGPLPHGEVLKWSNLQQNQGW